MSLGRRRTTGGTTTSIGGSTFLGPSYNNPTALGLGGLTSFPSTTGSGNNLAIIRTTTFGTALFTVTPTTTGVGGTYGNSRSGTAAITVTNPAAPTYGSASAFRRSAQYITEPRFQVNAPSMARLETERANRAAGIRIDWSRRPGIQVVMDGPVVVLRGTVGDRDERLLAEDIIRLTPGVRDVRNQLTVRQPTPGGVTATTSR